MLNAHQLRPEIEPDGSLGMADTACFSAIPHQVRERACPCVCLRACPRTCEGVSEQGDFDVLYLKEPSVSAILRESVAFYERPKRMGVKRRVKAERPEPALSERSEFRRRQRSLCPE
ncbi:hypothetical protein [Parabacteroides johnsonii]|uniref:hypothetical protein n=1 Tax=Parabacteroides johnsonii TaxID=387661 RepID=UPI00243108CE|nr:hypothetical protein [Parabacteroides johnsonii]